ncbi:hypothetical protein ACWCPQ_02615 [Nocardia sp. NPDC001965]
MDSVDSVDSVDSELIPGRGPASLVRDATETIVRLADDGTRDIRNRFDRFAGDIRDSAGNAEKVDETGADVVKKTRHGLTHVFGHDRDGVIRHFRLDRVRSVPLVDHEGEIVGVVFPTKKSTEIDMGDEELFSAWARMPNRLSDTEFIPETRVVSTGDAEETTFDAGPPQRAPWADDAEDGTIVVFSHAGPNGYRIEADVSIDGDPDWRVLSLPGGFFGDVLATNDYFRIASRAGPHKPLLMLACRAGDPAYPHAERAASAVHHAGMNHDVYSTVGLNGITYNPVRGTAELAVEVPENAPISDAFTIIRAPNGPPVR